MPRQLTSNTALRVVAEAATHAMADTNAAHQRHQLDARRDASSEPMHEAATHTIPPMRAAPNHLSPDRQPHEAKAARQLDPKRGPEEGDSAAPKPNAAAAPRRALELAAPSAPTPSESTAHLTARAARQRARRPHAPSALSTHCQAPKTERQNAEMAAPAHTRPELAHPAPPREEGAELPAPSAPRHAASPAAHALPAPRAPPARGPSRTPTPREPALLPPDVEAEPEDAAPDVEAETTTSARQHTHTATRNHPSSRQSAVHPTPD
jgi:hypothetical protein